MFFCGIVSWIADPNEFEFKVDVTPQQARNDVKGTMEKIAIAGRGKNRGVCVRCGKKFSDSSPYTYRVVMGRSQEILQSVCSGCM
jgi:hypothetical protein